MCGFVFRIFLVAEKSQEMVIWGNKEVQTITLMRAEAHCSHEGMKLSPAAVTRALEDGCVTTVLQL